MMNSSQKPASINSIDIIAFLYSKRKFLLWVALAAGILSAIVSFTIKPKFKSTVIMFPTTTSSVSKALMSLNPSAKQDILMLGEEEQAEQLLQIINSDEIRNRIIAKYNLMQHYEIDSTDRFKFTKLNEEFEGNVKSKRTEFMSVKVDVLDHDPIIASNIANDIAALVDTVKNRMLKERARAGFEIVKAEYETMKAYIQMKEDSMRAIMRMGVYDFESQSEVFNEQYAIAISKGNIEGAKYIQEKLDILAKYGSIYMSLRESLLNERKILSELKSKYDEAKVDAEQNIPHKFIVNNATPAEKKSYPIRSLIVLVTVVSSVFVAILALLIAEQIKNFNASKA